MVCERPPIGVFVPESRTVAFDRFSFLLDIFFPMLVSNFFDIAAIFFRWKSVRLQPYSKTWKSKRITTQPLWTLV